MKKAIEYYSELIKEWEEYEDKFELKGLCYEEFLIIKFKQIQEEAIRETVKECAENAEANIEFIGWLNENLEYYNIIKDQDYELSIDKNSILSIADKLIKEL